jgi:hypothetical protein
MRDDDHTPIGLQAEIDAGLPGGVITVRRSGRFYGKDARAEHQRTGGKYAAQKIAAADNRDRAGARAFRLHTLTPAAIFTACRIR